MTCKPLQRGAVRLAVAALLTVGIATAPRTLADPPGPGCDDVWSARVQGAPPYAAGDRGGFYLWHDNGFHLRVTHRGDDRGVYAGTVVSPTPMHVVPVDLESNDNLALSPDGHTMTFVFNNYGHTDGADFTTDCAQQLLVGPLTADSAPVSPDRIYLGASEIHPENNPMTIHRHDT